MAEKSPSLPRFPVIAVIGLGLIGGSLAKLIRHQLPETRIYGLDSPQTLQAALADGTLDGGLMDITDVRLAQCDLIILGTHLHQSYEILKTLVGSSKKPLNIMDIGSTKASICELADSLPGDFAFLGGHPLAGRETSGYSNSLWNLFFEKRFLLTPCQKTPPEFQAEVGVWLAELGAIPVSLGAGQHDSLMSLVSHFPQFYAVALANLLHQNDPNLSMKFLGGGIDDQMRLMASPYEMWRDVFNDNQTNLDHILTQFIGILSQMQQDLRTDKLAPWFEGSHEIYRLYQSNKGV